MALGLIGAGGIPNANMGAAKDWVDVVAIADVDAGRGATFNSRYSGGKAFVTDDYRRILDRKDVDVIHVATPDHWHTKPVIEAMLAGKDIYCEKPLTLTIDEGKLIREVQKETGRIVQVGTQQRSTFPLFVKAMALVADGPTAISGTATHPVAFEYGMPVEDDRYNTATGFLFTVKYPGDTEMVIRHDTANGVLIERDKGTIFVNRGKLTGAPVEALRDQPLPEDAIAKVYKNLPMKDNERKGHRANFFFCAKNKKEPISDVHSHMKMLNICHLAGICGRLVRRCFGTRSQSDRGTPLAGKREEAPHREGNPRCPIAPLVTAIRRT